MILIRWSFLIQLSLFYYLFHMKISLSVDDSWRYFNMLRLCDSKSTQTYLFLFIMCNSSEMIQVFIEFIAKIFIPDREQISTCYCVSNGFVYGLMLFRLDMIAERYNNFVVIYNVLYGNLTHYELLQRRNKFSLNIFI